MSLFFNKEEMGLIRRWHKWVGVGVHVQDQVWVAATVCGSKGVKIYFASGYLPLMIFRYTI